MRTDEGSRAGRARVESRLVLDGENRTTSRGREQVSLRHAVAILAGAMLGACATVQNTPQQDLVWSAYNQCKAEGRVPANIQLERVEPNGRPWFTRCGLR